MSRCETTAAPSRDCATNRFQILFDYGAYADWTTEEVVNIMRDLSTISAQLSDYVLEDQQPVAVFGDSGWISTKWLGCVCDAIRLVRGARVCDEVPGFYGRPNLTIGVSFVVLVEV